MLWDYLFISEGAIPFASADPIRVLPACVIGSAVSGALSMAFNCSLMAPHGGIFCITINRKSRMVYFSSCSRFCNSSGNYGYI